MDETRFLKGLYDGMRCGILSVDRAGRLVVLNDLGASILELDANPAPGTGIELALEGQPRLVRMLLDAFETQQLPTEDPYEELIPPVVDTMIRDVEAEENITVRTETVVARIAGEPGEFVVTLKKPGEKIEFDVPFYFVRCL